MLPYEDNVKEFANFANSFYKEIVAVEKENDRIKNRKKNSQLNKVTSRKKYLKSDKGKIAIKRRGAIRSRRHRDLSKNLTPEEKEQIRDFYAKRPEGYHVDHIIPLCKGGKHHVSNLQYLTAEENFKKSSYTPEEYLQKYYPEEVHTVPEKIVDPINLGYIKLIRKVLYESK